MANPDDMTDSVFSLVDLDAHNSWWNGEYIPNQTATRADLYWRVRNALEHDVLLIPGPATTGTTETLHQMVRVLIQGSAANGRLADLFKAPSFEDQALTDRIPANGFHPRQLCYVTCTDPLARLSESFVHDTHEAVSDNALKVPAAVDDLFVFYDQAHRLTNWRTQFLEEYVRLQRTYDTNWTLVLTLPQQQLAEAHEAELTSNKGDSAISYEVDEPHLSQKFRDTLQSVSELSIDRQASDNLITRSRTLLGQVAAGVPNADDLLETLDALHRTITEICTIEELSAILDWYLVDGGFTPAIASAELPSVDRLVASETPVPDERHERRIRTHVRDGIEQIIYQDIPSLMDANSDTTPRVEDVNDVYSLITYLARIGIRETTYGELAAALGVDDRTIRSKYIPLASNYHLLSKASRYNFQRDRSLRFVFQSPAYVTALADRLDFENRRSNLLYTAFAEHLSRRESPFDTPDPLAYWRGETGVIDYVLQTNVVPVPIIRRSETAEGSPANVFSAFRDAKRVETPPNLEIVIGDQATEPALSETPAGTFRLTVPDWLLLTVC